MKHTGGLFLPAHARAICVVEVGSAADVAAVNQRAGVSFTEVLEAVELRRSGPQGEMPASSARRDP